MEMRKLNLILLALLIVLPGIVNAAAPTRSFNYTAHTTIDPTQNNTNENSLYSYLQAGVDTYSPGSLTNDAISSSAAISYSKLNLINSILNADISSSAAITYSKLSLTGSIVNADINASAAIVDTKLATISTAGKVSGAALTSLSSTPSGAGIFPVANLGSGAPTASTTLRGDGSWGAGAGDVLISNTAVSGAANTGDIALSASSYYRIVFHLGALSGADVLLFRFNNSSAASYEYAYGGRRISAALTGGGTGATAFTLGTSAASNSAGYIDGDITVFTGSTTVFSRIVGNITYQDSAGGEFGFVDVSGSWQAGVSPTSFRLLTNGGATMTGNVLLYKLSTS